MYCIDMEHVWVCIDVCKINTLQACIILIVFWIQIKDKNEKILI